MEIAILMASGMGERLRPLTEKTPKPLLLVAGIPMIETVILGLLRRKVCKIFLVVGYLQEQFLYLKEKYSQVELLENKDYQTVNNISSIYYARHVIRREQGNFFICETDLFVADSSIFQVKLDASCYFGKRVKGNSDDWVIEVGKEGILTRIGKGGRDCYNMVGISYWKKEDAEKIADFVENIYGTPGYKKLFWDEVVNKNLNQLKLQIHSIKEDQIIEIDTEEELKEANTKFIYRR